jgi:hypothetical protein
MADKPSVKISGSGKSQIVTFTINSSSPIAPTHAEAYQGKAGYPAKKFGPPQRLVHARGQSTWYCKGPEACAQ